VIQACPAGERRCLGIDLILEARENTRMAVGINIGPVLEEGKK
jgi:hypothetical protein